MFLKHGPIWMFQKANILASWGGGRVLGTWLCLCLSWRFSTFQCPFNAPCVAQMESFGRDLPIVVSLACFRIKRQVADEIAAGCASKQHLRSSTIPRKVASLNLEPQSNSFRKKMLERLIPKFIYRLQRKQDLPLHGGQFGQILEKSESRFFGSLLISHWRHTDVTLMSILSFPGLGGRARRSFLFVEDAAEASRNSLRLDLYCVACRGLRPGPSKGKTWRGQPALGTVHKKYVVASVKFFHNRKLLLSRPTTSGQKLVVRNLFWRPKCLASPPSVLKPGSKFEEFVKVCRLRKHWWNISESQLAKLKSICRCGNGPSDLFLLNILFQHFPAFERFVW